MNSSWAPCSNHIVITLSSNLKMSSLFLDTWPCLMNMYTLVEAIYYVLFNLRYLSLITVSNWHNKGDFGTSTSFTIDMSYYVTVRLHTHPLVYGLFWQLLLEDSSSMWCNTHRAVFKLNYVILVLLPIYVSVYILQYHC